MFGRVRAVSLLVVGLLMMGSMASADAGWQSGGILESFRSWLGQPAQRTQLTVDHTDSGVVLTLTSSDTATVNQLQAALPKQKRSLSQEQNLRPKVYSDSTEEENSHRTEDDRYEDDEDENRSEDDEDHESE